MSEVEIMLFVYYINLLFFFLNNLSSLQASVLPTFFMAIFVQDSVDT